MSPNGPNEVCAAEVQLPCADLDATLAFFVERLGFRIESISPADDPASAVISGHGLRVRLDRYGSGAAGVVRIHCRDVASFAAGKTELLAPNGTRIELVAADPPLEVPPLRPAFVVSPLADAVWGTGRAGMRYRDLIPGRQGGRFIASHIQIPGGGRVPDYVHFHAIRFQLIYCYKGWVRVVYEDQGPPFVLHAGDCVLQPPRIRHRVLECSPGLEVIEMGSPANHATFADHDLELPTPRHAPERDFGGQRFVRHELATAEWQPWRLDGFECRDTGISVATGGVASAHVVRVCGDPATAWRHDAELVFVFVLAGAAALDCEGQGVHRLSPGDAFVVPAAVAHALLECSDDLELLEVTVPALTR